MRSREPRRQRERYSQPIRHSDNDIAHGLSRTKVMLGVCMVVRMRHAFRITRPPCGADFQPALEFLHYNPEDPGSLEWRCGDSRVLHLMP